MDQAKIVKQETGSTENDFMEVKIEDHPIESESEQYLPNIKAEMIPEIERPDIANIPPPQKKLFHCQHCAKTFKCKSKLVRHQTVHTGEKK